MAIFQVQHRLGYTTYSENSIETVVDRISFAYIESKFYDSVSAEEIDSHSNIKNIVDGLRDLGNNISDVAERSGMFGTLIKDVIRLFRTFHVQHDLEKFCGELNAEDR